MDICFAKGQCERGRQLPADTYCKSKGYTNATNFNTEHSLKRTRKIGDGDRCTGACRRFSYIQCARTVKSNPNPNDPPNYGGGNSKDEIIGGIVGGIIGGIIAGGGNNNNQPQPAPQPQPQPAPQFSNAHYQYCLNKYSSYNISSNTYTSYSGQLRYCNSPYN